MDGSDKVNVLCLNIEDNVKLMLYLHLSDTFWKIKYLWSEIEMHLFFFLRKWCYWLELFIF
jgi:hypothetical protein